MHRSPAPFLSWQQGLTYTRFTVVAAYAPLQRNLLFYLSVRQREIAQLNPNPLVDFRVLDMPFRQSLLRERLMGNLSAAFGVFAGRLSTLGLHGVMSYSDAATCVYFSLGLSSALRSPSAY
jgi:hypothetical protein